MMALGTEPPRTSGGMQYIRLSTRADTPTPNVGESDNVTVFAMRIPPVLVATLTRVVATPFRMFDEVPDLSDAIAIPTYIFEQEEYCDFK
jgi:hypothetical protein